MKDNWIFEFDSSADDIKTAPRFILGIKGERPLVCVGINPSTAMPGALDATLTRVERYATLTGKGYDSWIMLNLYPQRATDFSNVHKISDDALYRQNLKHMSNVLSQANVTDIWAAWGGDIAKRAFLKDCIRDLAAIAPEHGCSWKHVGSLTAAGHPRHPSRMAYEWGLNDFDMREYLGLIAN